MAKIAISFFLIALLVPTMTAFQFKSGKCPEVGAVEDFEMSRFLGVWHVVQGTITGGPVECLTFNITRRDRDRFIMSQLPQNLSSELRVRQNSPASKMGIYWSESDADFDVLVTDYDNFAAFLICRNNFEAQFQRAAGILSRSKNISTHHYETVKQHFHNYGIYDEDLTTVITCD